MFPYFSKHSLRGYFVTSIAVLNLKDVNINTEAFFFFFVKNWGKTHSMYYFSYEWVPIGSQMEPWEFESSRGDSVHDAFVFHGNRKMSYSQLNYGYESGV